jgi:uncharacterized membrane protein
MEKQTGRLEAFSDGVFGIAMTLLVLELKVPHLEGDAITAGALAAALWKQWPGYFAFVTSFFTILVMWVHHHMIFRHVRKVDNFLLFSNGFLLLAVTAVPFPTDVLSEYLRTPAASTACLLYAGIFVLIAVGFYLTLTAAFRPSVIDPDAPEKTIKRLRRDYAFGPPLYLAAVVAAPFSPVLALAICTGLWIFWAITAKEC